MVQIWDEGKRDNMMPINQKADLRQFYCIGISILSTPPSPIYSGG